MFRHPTPYTAQQLQVEEDVLKSLFVLSHEAVHAINNPLYKFWFRSEDNPHAGAAFRIEGLLSKGEVDAAEELKEQLPSIEEALAQGVSDYRSHLSGLDDPGTNLIREWRGEVVKQSLGSYIIAPQIFHKGSDTFVKRNFPPEKGGLLIQHLLTIVPMRNWDLAFKATIRAAGLDMTAHGEYAGSETPISEVKLNVASKCTALPQCAPAATFSDPNLFIGAMLANHPACLGGYLPDEDWEGAEDESRRGMTAAVAWAAMIGVDEQSLNGGMEQVLGNLIRASEPTFSSDAMLMAFCGMLIVRDYKSAFLFFKFLEGGLGPSEGDEVEPLSSEAKEKYKAALERFKKESFSSPYDDSDGTSTEKLDYDFLNVDTILLRNRFMVAHILPLYRHWKVLKDAPAGSWGVALQELIANDEAEGPEEDEDDGSSGTTNCCPGSVVTAFGRYLTSSKTK